MPKNNIVDAASARLGQVIGTANLPGGTRFIVRLHESKTAHTISM
jgi:hypothetical protein